MKIASDFLFCTAFFALKRSIKNEKKEVDFSFFRLPFNTPDKYYIHGAFVSPYASSTSSWAVRYKDPTRHFVSCGVNGITCFQHELLKGNSYGVGGLMLGGLAVGR